VDPYQHIFEQSIDDAAFLWVLRSVALEQPNYSVMDIAELEARIDKLLDCVMASFVRTWPLCVKACQFEEGGEAFVLGVTAFRSLEAEKIQQAVDFGLTNDDTFAGLVSALSWLPGSLCHEWIKRFFTSKDLRHKLLALAACRARSEDPAGYLDKILLRDDCMAVEPLKALAYRCVGEFKREDLKAVLDRGLAEMDDDIAEHNFWLIRSSILLGLRGLAERLEPFVFTENPFQGMAVQLAFRSLPLTIARQWISRLSESAENMRWVVKASVALGDPQVIPWLLQLMENPRYSRLCAEGFSVLTGIDLEKRELTIDVPDITELKADRDENSESIELDEDENLPWPNVDKLRAVWQKYGMNFKPGQRHFMGKPININTLKHVILHGSQRQRHAAALEMALLDVRNPVINIDRKVPELPVAASA